MADGLNRATLLGNIGRDPELKYTQGGTAVLKFSLATGESYLDAQNKRQERTEWHNVVVWGKRAEGLNKLFRKGMRAYIEGAIRTRSWEDKKDGSKRYATEIVASNVVLCDKAPSEGSGQRGSFGGGGSGFGNGGGFGSRQSPGDSYDGGPATGEDFGAGNDDDIPF